MPETNPTVCLICLDRAYHHRFKVSSPPRQFQTCPPYRICNWKSVSPTPQMCVIVSLQTYPAASKQKTYTPGYPLERTPKRLCRWTSFRPVLPAQENNRRWWHLRGMFCRTGVDVAHLFRVVSLGTSGLWIVIDTSINDDVCCSNLHLLPRGLALPHLQ